MTFLRTLVVFLIAGTLGFGYFVLLLANPGSKGREERVIIPHRATVQGLTDSLITHGLIRSKFSFALAARLLGTGAKLHEGTYRIEQGLSNSEILRRLTGSEFAVIFQVTFPEGITMYRAASIAHNKLNIDSGIFMEYAVDTQFLHSLGVPQEARTAEGYLFPDTYQFYISTDPKGLITTMIARWKVLVKDSLWKKYRTQATSSALVTTLHSLMTFASIVEGEAHRPNERDTIAGVYLNRLRLGMKLAADPTVQYGLHLSRPITHNDLAVPNAYNTYQNAGLPPGPVNSPGMAAIRAAINPARHNYLYFVARRDGSGGHYFSRSLAGQQQMIALSNANQAARK